MAEAPRELVTRAARSQEDDVTNSGTEIARPRPRGSLLRDLRSTLICILFALPLALLAGDGWVRAAGILYAVVYGLALIPSMASYLYLMFDALLITRGR